MADVLIHSRFPKELALPLIARYDLIYIQGSSATEGLTPDQLANIRAFVTWGVRTAVDAALFDAMPRLGAVICYGTGYDNVDIAEAARRGIVVGNSPGANASAVAEMAIALLLAAARRVVHADTFLRSGDWIARKPSPFLVPVSGITGRRIGIYGMGAIGQKIARFLRGFDVELAYHARSQTNADIRYLKSLEDLADWADTLIVAVRAVPENRHVVNADILRRLGGDGIVVNIARGTVIDQMALAEALKGNVINAAGLDVLDAEPAHPAELVGLPNVVMTPHIGGNTNEGRENLRACVIANLDAFLAGKPIPYQVEA